MVTIRHKVKDIEKPYERENRSYGLMREVWDTSLLLYSKLDEENQNSISS